MEEDTEEFESASGKSSISADLIRGHINTIILRSLYDRDKYGYEIINEINEKSHGQYTLKQPTLYSALKRLENQGYIQAYWKSDEVSSGGRRKYFRLTDSGKEVTEQNQAEWEYSRTVIDNLISDKNFDFSQPAPTPVDFKILKQATSRVPVIHGEEEAEEFTEAVPEKDETNRSSAPEVEAMTFTVAERSDTVYIDDPSAPSARTAPAKKDEVPGIFSYAAETEKDLNYSERIFNDGFRPTRFEGNQPEADALSYDSNEKSTAYNAAAGEIKQTYAEIPGSPVQQNNFINGQPENIYSESIRSDIKIRTENDGAGAVKQDNLRYANQLEKSLNDEDSRRIAHENYLKLIAGEEKPSPNSDLTPYADNMDTTKLVYNMRSEQERDYKNLIDRLFDNTLKNTEPSHTQPQPASAEPARQTVVRSEFYEASDKAAADGLKISTSDDAFAAGKAKQSTYNKGATLFKCSLITGVLILLEFTLTMLFREELGIALAYPIIILALGLALVLVCGILLGARYGMHVRRPTSLRYISTACIITVLIIFIVFIFAIILHVNWSVTADVLVKVVIPCIVALNIPIFTLAFYLLTK